MVERKGELIQYYINVYLLFEPTYLLSVFRLQQAMPTKCCIVVYFHKKLLSSSLSGFTRRVGGGTERGNNIKTVLTRKFVETISRESSRNLPENLPKNLTKRARKPKASPTGIIG